VFKPFSDHSKLTASNESTRLWEVINGGLQLFGIELEHVRNIIGIELPIRYSTKVFFSLSNGRLGFLIGDAAFQTHFWPGRGLNSSFKGAAHLAWCIADSYAKSNNHMRVTDLNVSFFISFMSALRIREHDFRSLIFWCGNSMIDHVNGAITDEGSETQRAELKKRILKTRDRFRRSKELPDMTNTSNLTTISFTEEKLDELLKSLNAFALNVMLRTGSWPETRGAEILPRDFIGNNRFRETESLLESNRVIEDRNVSVTSKEIIIKNEARTNITLESNLTNEVKK
jgi:hypothetical protein